MTIEHAMAVRHLTFHHHDPFDRMLIAQTQVEGLAIVTRDSDILRYSVSHLLA
jgi:PIN domain nuclease of toxin-antitoxin system